MCHQYHPIQFHSYPKRKVRSPEKGKNIEIRIPVVKCPIEKAAGCQYTKRILPGFLAPFRVIRQDLALISFIKFEYNKPLTPPDRETIALILGCIDLRTVNKHIQAITKKMRSAQSEIYRFLSSHYNDLPQMQPDANLSNTTLTLIRQLKDCCCTVFGMIMPESFFDILPVIGHLDRYGYFSMTYASRNKALWDTS